MARESLCIICLDSDPQPIQSGCACRSDTGLAHVGCLVEKALAQRAHRGARVWWECQTCEQMFTGPMRTGLAGAWWALVCDEVDSSDDRLAAACNLAQARSGDGRHAEAERLNREVLRVRKQVLGYGHPETMASAGNLALSLSNQGKHAEAERINREVLRARRSGRPGRSGGPGRPGRPGSSVLGDEHPDTLLSANNLAVSLSGQGKHEEAELINREVLRARKHVLGEEHPDTLTSGSNLASSLSHNGKHEEAELINRAILGVRRRVLGDEHPDTLTSGGNLAAGLLKQGKHAEAVLLMRDVLCAQMRVLGEAHPDTLRTRSNLAVSLSRQGDHVEAEEMCHAALASRIRVLGISHPDTLRTARNLEFIRTSMTARPEVRGKHKTQTAAEAEARGAG